MAYKEKSTIRTACRKILRPIAAMMLKCGMTWKEFSDLSKSVFVETATLDYGIRGRLTNVSRVSILTGISRKEVKRQRDLLAAAEPPVREKTTDATRLLSGWHLDQAYLDADASPCELPEKGAAPSFESLCAAYGGDVPATAMLKELLTANAVERMAGGKLRAISRYYQPAAHDEEILRFASSRISELTETMTNNAFPGDPHIPRFEGFADNDRMAPDMVPKFREFLDKRGQEFLEEIDEWLSKHESSSAMDKTKHVRIGIGLYAIEDRAIKEL